MKQMKTRQRGGVLLVLIVVGMLAYIGLLAAQVFPTYAEYQAVKKAVKRAAEGNSVTEIRNNFDKAAVADDIKSITGKDIELSKEGDKNVVKFAYSKEIHMFGPAYLVMKYAGDSK